MMISGGGVVVVVVAIVVAAVVYNSIPQQIRVCRNQYRVRVTQQ